MAMTRNLTDEEAEELIAQALRQENSRKAQPKPNTKTTKYFEGMPDPEADEIRKLIYGPLETQDMRDWNSPWNSVFGVDLSEPDGRAPWARPGGTGVAPERQPNFVKSSMQVAQAPEMPGGLPDASRGERRLYSLTGAPPSSDAALPRPAPLQSKQGQSGDVVVQKPGRSDSLPATQQSKPHRAISKWGVHPEAADALGYVNIAPGRIGQTVGNAGASSGFHLMDGRVNGQPYSAAVDIRTGALGDGSKPLTEKQIHELLEQLGRAGFAAWYRRPGEDDWPKKYGPHIHAVYAGVPMKPGLERQVDDYINNRTGLKGHRRYGFHTYSAESIAAVKAKRAGRRHR